MWKVQSTNYKRNNLLKQFPSEFTQGCLRALNVDNN